MKKFFFIAAVAAATLSSCHKQENSNVELDAATEEGVVKLRIAEGSGKTKSLSEGKESAISDIQVMMFNENGELYRYHALATEEIASQSCELSNVKVGTYRLYAVANGPVLDTVKSMAGLLSVPVELGEYNSPSDDFIMVGGAEVTVSVDAKTDVSDTLRRLVSRVSLIQIKNNLPAAYDSMTVNYAVLSNVAGNQVIGGDDTVSTWYNKDGRADETPRNSAHIIGTGTYKASCENLTFRSIAATVANGALYSGPEYFYSYANPRIGKGEGFSEPYAEKATSLDISITFGGKTYYYDVTLPDLKTNWNYDVKVQISGEGEEEPGKRSKKGSISAVIIVKDWIDAPVSEIEI